MIVCVNALSVFLITERFIAETWADHHPDSDYYCAMDLASGEAQFWY